MNPSPPLFPFFLCFLVVCFVDEWNKSKTRFPNLWLRHWRVGYRHRFRSFLLSIHHLLKRERKLSFHTIFPNSSTTLSLMSNNERQRHQDTHASPSTTRDESRLHTIGMRAVRKKASSLCYSTTKKTFFPFFKPLSWFSFSKHRRQAISISSVFRPLSLVRSSFLFLQSLQSFRRKKWFLSFLMTCFSLFFVADTDKWATLFVGH